MSVIQAPERNSLARANKKIKGPEKYGGQSPGHLDLILKWESWGSLSVYLGKASLFGKKSQDSYAVCYLLDKAGNTFFQDNNHQTEIFKKNIEPYFNHEFRFDMSLSKIVGYSLVIAMWDKDSSSRDDYMAGLRISLEDIQYFRKRETVRLELMHQAQDGHPAAYVDEISFLRKIFDWYMVSTSSNLDLKGCNDHLVSFIERVRVLAAAYDFQNNLPSELTNQVTSAPLDVKNLFREEIARMREKMEHSKIERTRVENERNSLRRTRETLLAERTQLVATLGERRKECYNLCCQEAEVRAQFGSLEMMKKKSEVLWGKVNFSDIQTPGFGFENNVNTHVPNFTMGGGGHHMNSKQQEFLNRVITDYEQKMRAQLELMRGKYRAEYEKFILNLERDGKEIIRLYEDILREKFKPRRKDGLLAIWEGRNYQGRINALLADIEELKRKIAGLEGVNKEDWYKQQINELDAKIRALMDQLRALFAQYKEFTSVIFRGVDEVSFYKQLLNFEEKRMSTRPYKVEYQVRQTSSRAHRSSKYSVSNAGTGRMSVGGDSAIDISSPVGGQGYTQYQESFSRSSSTSGFGGSGRPSLTLKNLQDHV